MDISSTDLLDMSGVSKSDLRKNPSLEKFLLQEEQTKNKAFDEHLASLNKSSNLNSPKVGTDIAYDISRTYEQEFLIYMYNMMLEMVDVNELTGGGSGEETFRSLLNQEILKDAFKNYEGPIAKRIYEMITRRMGGNDDNINERGQQADHFI